MNICIISAHFPPKKNAGAVRIESFVRNWQKEKCELVVITEKNGYKPDDWLKFENVKFRGVFLKLVDNKKGIIVRIINELLFGLNLFVILFFKTFDKIIITSPPFFPVISIMLLCKIKKIPYIIDVRDLYPDVLFDVNILSSKSRIGSFFLFLEKKVYKNAFSILTVTEGLKKKIESKTVSPVHLIRNGADKSIFKQLNVEKEKNFTLLFHGILGKFQNIDLIITYACYLKDNNINDIVIQIYGNGPKLDYLQQCIKNKGLGEILKYNGIKQPEDFPVIINKAHIGLSPRIDGEISKNAFPVKVYEYLACGIPVIITPYSEAGEILESNKCGLQIDNNVNQLHSTIIQIKNNDSFYRELSQNALVLSEKFDRAKLAKLAYTYIIK